ncbi:MAG: hypothetical protein Q4G49_12475 [Paracoccus sp. (in: a-proteobacteria)]|nr:hypothetical protein [Paracoccus sp. (in: a-proteobacteria)]
MNRQHGYLRFAMPFQTWPAKRSHTERMRMVDQGKVATIEKAGVRVTGGSNRRTTPLS